MPSAVDFEKALLRTLREDAGLSALVGGKVFALLVPPGTTLPCVSFQRLGGRPANTLAGASGLEEIDLLIDAWARDYHEAKAIAKAVCTTPKRVNISATSPSMNKKSSC